MANHLFLITDSICLVTRTLRFNLLKTNAIIRGWSAVLFTNVKVQKRKTPNHLPSYCSLGKRTKQVTVGYSDLPVII